MTDAPTPAALSEPMSDERLAEIDAFLRLREGTAFDLQPSVMLMRELRAEVTRLLAAAEAETAAFARLARYDCATGGCCHEPDYGCDVYGTMELDDSGEWVRIEDVFAARAPHSPAAGASETEGREP